MYGDNKYLDLKKSFNIGLNLDMGLNFGIGSSLNIGLNLDMGLNFE